MNKKQIELLTKLQNKKVNEIYYSLHSGYVYSISKSNEMRLNKTDTKILKSLFFEGGKNTKYNLFVDTLLASHIKTVYAIIGYRALIDGTEKEIYYNGDYKSIEELKTHIVKTRRQPYSRYVLMQLNHLSSKHGLIIEHIPLDEKDHVIDFK